VQETTKETIGKLDEGLVRPNDDVTVYTTKVLKSLYKVGTPVVLHSFQAKKWIESGKAVAEEKDAAKEPIIDLGSD